MLRSILNYCTVDYIFNLHEMQAIVLPIAECTTTTFSSFTNIRCSVASTVYKPAPIRQTEYMAYKCSV